MILTGPENFLARAQKTPIADVRSPAEFADGHIPGAFNLPVFSNSDRKTVGTLYKQSGRDTAILEGLKLVGPKLHSLVLQAHEKAPGREILIHCWRGGLRSKNMAWLLELAGFRVTLLEGGYKAYRSYIREQLGKNENMVVLGGKTGSGKTEILENIKASGHQILNLEAIACHKGSAFGDLGQADQPSNEQFENNLYAAVSGLDSEKVTWVEDESRGIGRIGIPEPFYKIIRNTEVIFLDVPRTERVRRLVKEYAGFHAERLSAAIVRISKKLGGLDTRLALEALESGDFSTVADQLLKYYDKAYLKGLSMRLPQHVNTLAVSADNPQENARLAIRYFTEIVSEKLQPTH